MRFRFIIPLFMVFAFALQAFASEDFFRDLEQTLSQILKPPPGPAYKKIKAYKEIDCIRKTREGSKSLDRRPMTEKLMKNISPRLQELFEKHKIGPIERAVVYGNMMMETGYFSAITEIGSLKKGGCWSTAFRMEDTNAGCKKLRACDQGEHKHFNCNYWPSALHRTSNRKKHCGGSAHPYAKTGRYGRHRGPKKGERYGNRYKGRGLLQQTWCYNYLSFWHGRNGEKSHLFKREILPTSLIKNDSLVHSKENGVEYVSLHNSKVMDGFKYCSKEDVKGLRQRYQKAYGKELDPFGILEDPTKLSNHCATLTSRDGKKKKKAAELLVESAIDHLVNGGCKVPRARLRRALKNGTFKVSNLKKKLKKKKVIKSNKKKRKRVRKGRGKKRKVTRKKRKKKRGKWKKRRAASLDQSFDKGINLLAGSMEWREVDDFSSILMGEVWDDLGTTSLEGGLLAQFDPEDLDTLENDESFDENVLVAEGEINDEDDPLLVAELEVMEVVEEALSEDVFLRSIASAGSKEEKLINGMIECVLGAPHPARKPYVLKALKCVKN